MCKATEVEGEEDPSGFDSERVTNARNGVNRRRPFWEASKDDVVIDHLVVVDEVEEEEREMKEMGGAELKL